MRRVLITRPTDDAAPLVAALQARGVEAMVEPMMTSTLFSVISLRVLDTALVVSEASSRMM